MSAHWKAEAFKLAREAEVAAPVQSPSSTDVVPANIPEDTRTLKITRTMVEQAHSLTIEAEVSGQSENKRMLFVQSILDKKGWSTNQLSVEAEVDFHTVNDYLKGRTKPNSSTRKQLAEALGVPVENLPR